MLKSNIKINSALLVDDNKATNYIHSKYIAQSNLIEEAVTFQAGAKAIEYLTNAAQMPELIFLDINMPTMDAWEFLEELKLLPTTKLDSVIILLTTTISPEDEERMKAYPEVKKKIMFKPLNTEVIKKVVAEFFE